MADDLSENGASREERIAQQRRELPDAPGVYLFYDSKGELLYVGKRSEEHTSDSSHRT